VLVFLFSSASALVIKEQYQSEQELNENILADRWIKVFGREKIDQCFSAIQTNDQGYALIGWTSSFGSGSTDVWLIKTNINGDQVWNKTYGGIKRDRGLSLQQTEDNGFIICGFTESYGEGLYDLWLIRTDEGGNEVWNRTYGGGDYDYGVSIKITQDNKYIVTGYTSSFGSINSDAWLINIDLDGNIIWDNIFGGLMCESGFEVLEIDDGYIFSGYTESFGNGGYDSWVIKTDKTGNLTWKKTYGGALEDVVRSIKETSDGGYILAGWTKSIGSGNKDLWLYKIDEMGNVIWEKTYGGIFNDGAYSIQKTNDGNYIIAGFADKNGFSDFLLLKIDQTGNIIWEKTYGGILDEEANSVSQTVDGGFIIGGWTKSYGSGREDIWLVKTDQNGNSHSKALSQCIKNDFFDNSIIRFLINFFNFKINRFVLL
jgi:hypothetical protein